MYSLRLVCSREQIDQLSAELWEAGTIGIHELDSGNQVVLLAAFDAPEPQPQLLTFFAGYSPAWQTEPATDWTEQTKQAWPGREIGERLFFAPPWCGDPTPPGRERIVHVPGLACGTGEHPCTRLALVALEKSVRPDTTLIDIGTGSGILAIAALRLGAPRAIGIDTDESALATARSNCSLNALQPVLIVGSAECVTAGAADITVANINGTVLLSILDDLLRITRRHGRLILTGFTNAELRPFRELLHVAEVSTLSGWSCLTATLS
jgi:ribosomal protein L11 methyltransferase